MKPKSRSKPVARKKKTVAKKKKAAAKITLPVSLDQLSHAALQAAISEAGDHLNISLKRLVVTFQGYCDKKFPDTPGAFLQVATEVLAFHLGYLDGLATVGGVPKDTRDALRLESFQGGKQLVIKEHDATDCSDCDTRKKLVGETQLH